MNIKIYTDGACSGNPGPGGYGCILTTILPNGKPYETKHSGGYRMTTNNRMELAAVIYGLLALNGSHDIEIISDSKYVCDSFNQGWVWNWKKAGWRNTQNKIVPNVDMWQTLTNLLTMQDSYKFTWVKGHNGHPYNEECDRLAVCAIKDSQNWQIDDYYESTICIQ